MIVQKQLCISVLQNGILPYHNINRNLMLSQTDSNQILYHNMIEQTAWTTYILKICITNLWLSGTKFPCTLHFLHLRVTQLVSAFALTGRLLVTGEAER